MTMKYMGVLCLFTGVEFVLTVGTSCVGLKSLHSLTPVLLHLESHLFSPISFHTGRNFRCPPHTLFVHSPSTGHPLNSRDASITVDYTVVFLPLILGLTSSPPTTPVTVLPFSTLTAHGSTPRYPL